MLVMKAFDTVHIICGTESCQEFACRCCKNCDIHNFIVSLLRIVTCMMRIIHVQNANRVTS